jgi:hypothetical protein
MERAGMAAVLGHRRPRGVTGQNLDSSDDVARKPVKAPDAPTVAPSSCTEARGRSSTNAFKRTRATSRKASSAPRNRPSRPPRSMPARTATGSKSSWAAADGSAMRSRSIHESPTEPKRLSSVERERERDPNCSRARPRGRRPARPPPRDGSLLADGCTRPRRRGADARYGRLAEAARGSTECGGCIGTTTGRSEPLSLSQCASCDSPMKIGVASPNCCK